MNYKLETINTLNIEGFDTHDDSIAYVAIANSIENVAVLKTLGATDEDFANMKMDEDTLDVAYFAFTKCGAETFSIFEGFGV